MKVITKETMIIETERLILREYTVDDFDALYEILSDPETMQHYPAPKNEISYAYAISRKEWEKVKTGK